MGEDMNNPVSETLIVRDPMRPCEHGYRNCHFVYPRPPSLEGLDQSGRCPGGAEIILSKVTAVWEGDMAVIRVDPGGEYWINLEV